MLIDFLRGKAGMNIVVADIADAFGFNQVAVVFLRDTARFREQLTERRDHG